MVAHTPGWVRYILGLRDFSVPAGVLKNESVYGATAGSPEVNEMISVNRFVHSYE